jgi:GAF domain-containing protein
MLESSRVVRFVDRDGDPMSEEFRSSYLAPLGITAMLDAPILQGGDIIGIVCHEHVVAAREWTNHECEFAASVRRHRRASVRGSRTAARRERA